jgi:hypothetical protein
MKLLRCYEQILHQRHGVFSETLDLALLPSDFLTSVLYQPSKLPHPEWQLWQEKVDALDVLVFVIPEYNGSYPGILKAFIDALAFPRSLQGKRTAYSLRPPQLQRWQMRHDCFRWPLILRLSKRIKRQKRVAKQNLRSC